MNSWILATIPFVLAILRGAIKNEKSKALFKEVGWAMFVTVTAIWPEFLAQPVSAAQRKKALAALPKVA